MDSSLDIQAAEHETTYGRPRIMLKETNSDQIVKQTLRKKKLWLHITRTTIRPPAARVVTYAVVAAVAASGVNAVAGTMEVT